MPAILAKRTEPHRFVPDTFEAADPQSINGLFDQLQEQDTSTPASLENLILNFQELNSAIYERLELAYVDMTSDTTNEEYEHAFIEIIENILPILEERGFHIKRKIIESPALDALPTTYETYLRDIRAEVELFRQENVPLLVEDQKLGQEFEKIVGAQQVHFRGETYTTTQIEQFFDSLDRPTREEAWRARAGAFLRDADRLDDLYDKMYEIRQRIAQNAGFANYRDYIFKEKKRFDYTPQDCMDYHRAVEQHVVPVVQREWEAHKGKLGVETLRPWDVNVRPNDPVVDPDGREPLRPFDTIERLSEGCERIFTSIDSELGGFYREMQRQKLLDLDNRPGKAPGAYMTSFSDRHSPFIMMNAVGGKGDVETLLHEAGHAFHYCLARHQPLSSYHHTTHEFSEVASMGMELLARPYLTEFYTQEELGPLLDDQIRGSVRTLYWVAMLDAFQHWVYTAEDHGREARKAKWIELEERFRPSIDWTGLEQYREIGWQYPHVFDTPFYYIEYGIAQLAAFRVWLNSLEDQQGAVDAYKHALGLGGSRPLPELFEAAGAHFSLGERTVGEIMRGVMAQVGSGSNSKK